MEKNSLNQKMNYQELTDSEMGFFEIDFWDFTNKIDYELTDYQQKILGKHGKLSLDFTNVINNNIKEEFKYYWFHKIYRSGWKETNLIIYRSVFKELCTFFNLYLSDEKSMTTKTKEQLVFLLKNHLIEKGKSINVKRGHKLNKNNEKIQRTTDVREIKTLIDFYDFIFDTQQNNDIPLIEKDTWTINEMNLTKEQIGGTIKPKSISFKKIKQNVMKRQMKDYILTIKNLLRIGTIMNHISSFNKFSEFLHEHFPAVQDINELNRTHIESFFSVIEMKSLKQTTKRGIKTDLKNVLEKMDEFQIIKMNEVLFYEEDFHYKIRTKPPETIPDSVLEQLNNVLDKEDVSITLARMILVIQHIGCRISELCQLPFGSISCDSEGDYHLRYFQLKTSKWINVPVEEGIAILIIKQEKETREKHPDSKHIFLNNHANTFTSENFSTSINELAYKYNIVDEHGNIFRFKSHSFRRTKASSLMNAGVQPQIIAKVLGHSDMSSLKHYAKMNDENIISALKVIDEFQKQITDISFEYQEMSADELSEINLSKYIPLPNGFCGSKDECKTAFACYSCPFFKPHKHFLPQYEKQLLLAKQSLQIAKLNKLQRQVDTSEQLINKIEKVIQKVNNRR